jgi:hypothetical protein
VINPNNKDLMLPTSSFPRLDQSCIPVTFSGASGQNCTSDEHPFFNDMQPRRSPPAAATIGAQSLTSDGTPQLVLKKTDRQPPGSRAVIAVADTATAAR